MLLILVLILLCVVTATDRQTDFILVEKTVTKKDSASVHTEFYSLNNGNSDAFFIKESLLGDNLCDEFDYQTNEKLFGNIIEKNFSKFDSISTYISSLEIIQIVDNEIELEFETCNFNILSNYVIANKTWYDQLIKLD